MPDQVPTLAHNPLRSLTPGQLKQLAQYTDPLALVGFLGEVDWTYGEEIQEIVSLARQEENLSVKLNAIKYLRQLTREALQSAGLLVGAKRTITAPDGSVTTLTAQIVASALQGPPTESKGDSNGHGKQEEDNGSGGRPNARDGEGTEDTGGESGRSSGIHGAQGGDGGEGGGNEEGGEATTEAIDERAGTGHRPPDASNGIDLPGLASGTDATS